MIRGAAAEDTTGMPISITCPGCHQRFSVHDKFAGKQGPCPKCKTVLTIPEKKDEVVIHAPEPTGTKTATGVPTLKPLKRKDGKLSPPILIGGAVYLLLAVGGALAIRFLFPSPAALSPGGQAQIPWWPLALGAIALAPPLVWSMYTFLRDDELEGYSGQALWTRVAICSVVYAGLWGLRWYLGAQLEWTPPLELYQNLVLIPAMLIPGTIAPLAALDLDATNAAVHCAGYLGLTVLLRLVCGLPPL